ncbi:arsenic resistance protein [Ruania zhangjianzhongii]|uniref:arsenic resistance protein n=1 Tax=Ruania zhangjianzhongii TaxID=2603206 RepID=UPI0011CB8852|nr:bile acid:sodium symporter [Ruania zhangjianzhongii]
MTTAEGWMERRQVPLYLVALAAGAGLGLLVPGVTRVWEVAINPVLALLMYLTFLGVPFRAITTAVRDRRFLVTAVVVNFAVVPVLVFGLTRFVAHEQAVVVGMAFVLLCPCVDYVIVFTGLAGGAQDRLLAATPVLMLGQMLLLPGYLWLFVGGEAVAAVDLGPFVTAFAVIIVLPLAAAALTQRAAVRTRWAAAAQERALSGMVPVMMLTLGIVVASQIGGVGARLGVLVVPALVYVLFAALMVPIGIAAGRIAQLDLPARRAVVFTGATRNSLVVLPLVLALPAGYELAPLVVVTQTLVELVAMVVFVRLVPRLVPADGPLASR